LAIVGCGALAPFIPGWHPPGGAKAFAAYAAVKFEEIRFIFFVKAFNFKFHG
jgi:hypothetical protein